MGPTTTTIQLATPASWQERENRMIEAENRFPYAMAQFQNAARFHGLPNGDDVLEQFYRLVAAFVSGVDAEPWPELAAEGITADHELFWDKVTWAADVRWFQPAPLPAGVQAFRDSITNRTNPHLFPPEQGPWGPGGVVSHRWSAESAS